VEVLQRLKEALKGLLDEHAGLQAQVSKCDLSAEWK
jgi:hypothetical protein